MDVFDDMQNICNILSYSMSLEKKLTFPKLLDIWLGKGEKKLRPQDMKVCKYTREIAQQIIGLFLIDNYLKEEFHFTPYSTISYVNIGPAWLTCTTHSIIYSLPSSKEPMASDKKKNSAPSVATKRKKLVDDAMVITLD